MRCSPAPITPFGRLAVVLLCTATAATGLAADREFAIGKDGRSILLPLTVGDREILCLVDTGASRSAFDVSLRPLLGTSRGTKTIQTPAGRRSVDQFAWPDARLGAEMLKSERPVVCIDLDNTRKASGQDMFAVLGMDVLRSRRIQIDFDAGSLRILESLPADRSQLGQHLPISFAADDTPSLAVSIGEGHDVPFLIDTGTLGNSIEADQFDDLLEQNRIRLGGPSLSVTVGGAIAGEAGRLDRLSVGPFVHRDLRMARLNVNSLGLRYLSRFRVTFDFPGGNVYLHQGANFSRPEPTATSGLSLAWVDGEVTVQAVLKDGPAAGAGIRPHDVLVRVDGSEASRYDHHSLRALLTSAVGRQVPLTIRRQTAEIDVTLVLTEK